MLRPCREARGLLAYIRNTHTKSDEGYTLKRMEMERLLLKQGWAVQVDPGFAPLLSAFSALKP